MNSPDKNQTIAVLVAGSKDCVTQAEAEELQYNLLGRGFRWDNPKGYLGHIDLRNFTDWVLLVNVKTKTLKWRPNQPPFVSSDNAYSVIQLWSSGLSNAIRHIVKPPTAPREYVEVKGMDLDSNQKVRVYTDDGAVQFYEDDDHLLTTDKATIKGIAKELDLLIMKDTDSKVVVTVLFSYPDSTYSWKHLCRTVQVTAMDDEFIKGVEVYRDGTSTGTYKIYRRSKIDGDIVLTKFEVK